MTYYIYVNTQMQYPKAVCIYPTQYAGSRVAQSCFCLDFRAARIAFKPCRLDGLSVLFPKAMSTECLLTRSYAPRQAVLSTPRMSRF